MPYGRGTLLPDDRADSVNSYGTDRLETAASTLKKLSIWMGNGRF